MHYRTRASARQYAIFISICGILAVLHHDHLEKTELLHNYTQTVTLYESVQHEWHLKCAAVEANLSECRNSQTNTSTQNFELSRQLSQLHEQQSNNTGLVRDMKGSLEHLSQEIRRAEQETTHRGEVIQNLTIELSVCRTTLENQTAKGDQDLNLLKVQCMECARLALDERDYAANLLGALQKAERIITESHSNVQIKDLDHITSNEHNFSNTFVSNESHLSFSNRSSNYSFTLSPHATRNHTAYTPTFDLKVDPIDDLKYETLNKLININ